MNCSFSMHVLSWVETKHTRLTVMRSLTRTNQQRTFEEQHMLALRLREPILKTQWTYGMNTGT
jgi:hypothetical protein